MSGSWDDLDHTEEETQNACASPNAGRNRDPKDKWETFYSQFKNLVLLQL